MSEGGLGAEAGSALVHLEASEEGGSGVGVEAGADEILEAEIIGAEFAGALRGGGVGGVDVSAGESGGAAVGLIDEMADFVGDGEGEFGGIVADEIDDGGGDGDGALLDVGGGVDVGGFANGPEEGGRAEAGLSLGKALDGESGAEILRESDAGFEGLGDGGNGGLSRDERRIGESDHDEAVDVLAGRGGIAGGKRGIDDELIAKIDAGGDGGGGSGLRESEWGCEDAEQGEEGEGREMKRMWD